MVHTNLAESKAISWIWTKLITSLSTALFPKNGIGWSKIANRRDSIFCLVSHFS